MRPLPDKVGCALKASEGARLRWLTVCARRASPDLRCEHERRNAATRTPPPVPRRDTIRIERMRRKQLSQWRCEECGRTGTVTPGPRGELGMCECGATVPLGCKTPWKIDRRRAIGFFVWGLTTIASNIVSNLLTPPVARVANLIRKPRIKPLEVGVDDRITMSDQVIVAAGIPSACKFGTPVIVHSTAAEQSDRA